MFTPLLFALFTAPATSAPPASSAPLQEDLPDGHIDWSRYRLIIELSSSQGSNTWQDTRTVEQNIRESLALKLDERARGIRIYGDVTAGELMSGGGDVSRALEVTDACWDVTEARYYTSGRVTLHAELDLQAWLSPALVAEAKGSAQSPASPPASTGVIVDARGLGLSPSVAPRLISTDGAVLYGVALLSHITASTETPVLWVQDPIDPRAFARGGANPIFLQGASVQDDTDLVLGATDAAKLEQLAAHSDLLGRARVVIVVD